MPFLISKNKEKNVQILIFWNKECNIGISPGPMSLNCQ